MAEIYFRINADFEKVQLLKTKIDELTTKLKSMDQATDPKGFRQLEKQLQSTTKEFNSLVSQAAIAGAQLKKANQDAGDSAKGFGDLNSVLMKIGGTAALTKLGSDIVQVRGEFQQLEIAFTTLLGSKEKSDALMNQMVDTAMKTPYSLQGVASGARQLLAYGFAAEDVNDVLIRLGNVASGLGLPLERLTYLYGTTRVQGRLYARDMLQFTSSGIPLLQKLADMYGVSTDKINDMVTAGKIGFSDVEKVFKSMTDQGGMFYNLMENQSKSFTGQISNIKDQISKVLNDIGKSNEGLINGGLGGVKMLIDNYETVGKVLVGLIATYGTYKTAVMIVTTVQKEQAAINAMVTASNGVFNTSLAAQWLWTERLQKAQDFLNKTMLTNPYVAVATAIVGVIAVTWALSDSTTSAEKAQKDFNASMEAQKQQLDETENKAKSLIETIKSETTTQYDKQKALQTLQRMMPSIFRNMDIETLKLMKQVSLYKQLAEWKNRQALIGAKTNAILQNQEIARLEKEKKNGPTSSMETPEAFNARMDKQIEKAKALRSLYQKSVDEINSISEKAAFNAQPKSVKLQSLNSDKSSLEVDIKRLEAEKQKAEKEGRFFGSQYLLTAKRGQLSEINKTISSLNSKTKKTVLDKDYWDELKKSATASLNSIDSKVLERLKAGKTSGIDKKTIELYKKAVGDLNKAKDNLGVYDTTGKADKAARTAAEKANEEKVKEDERKAKINENNKKISEVETQAEIDRTQSKIDLMDEGFAKQQAQIDLNFKKQIADAKKKTEELIKAQNANDKLAFENKNPNWKKQGISYTPITSVSQLPEDQQETAKGYFTVANETMLKATNDLIKNLLDKHQDYNTKKVELEKQYNDDIEALTIERAKAESKGDAETVAKLTSAITQAKVDKGKALMSLSFEHLKESPDYARAFEDLNNTSTETLNSLLSQLQEAKGEAAKVLNPQDLKEYTDAIQSIIDKLTERDPFKALIDRKKEVAEAGKELAEAQRQLSVVKSGGEIVSGTSIKNGRIENTYLDEKTAIENVNKAKDNYTKKNNELVKAEKLVLDQITDLSNALKGLGDTIGGSAGQVISLIGDVGNFAATTSSSITKVAATGAQAISTIEKASVILAIISAAIQLTQKLSSLLPDSYAEYEKYDAKIEEINKITDAVNEYQLAVLKANQEEKKWFSEDKLQSLKDYKEQQKEIFKEYQTKLEEGQAVYQNKSGNGWLTGISKFGQRVASYVTGQKLLDKILGTDMAGSVETLIAGKKYSEGTTATINNLRIETRKKSKGFLGTGIGGKSQKTEDLVSWVKENLGADLFSSDGWINQSAYDTIMDKYSDKLVGQTKETLTELNKLKEEYDEYQKQLKEYVSNLYEPVVDNMVSSLWDWLDNGKNALDSFKDYAGDTFKKIVTDMLKTIVLQKVVGSFSDDISKIYEQYSNGSITEEDLAKQVADKTNELMGRYKDQAPALENTLSTISEIFKGVGIDITGKSSQNSTSGSFQTMSQDQGHELNGRFTALQAAGEEIKTQSLLQTSIQAKILEAIQPKSLDATTSTVVVNTSGGASQVSNDSSSDKYSQLLTVNTEAKMLVSKNIDIAGEIRDIQVNSFYELQKITKNTGATVDGVSQSNTYLKKIADKL
ncbi:tape measure protein [uncultured Bacteroides sp.]|uniref:tape measure protein n=1 Tax=uncultured Bacteroides sp. TaxID=162156 RepID=UPI002AAAA462|nr:tape measure protein [uncultured Bacteroides sp.]